MNTSQSDTIFVQMASYRDPQLIPTLIDMVDNATNPENLVICVCWQHGPEETCFDLPNRLPMEPQKFHYQHEYDTHRVFSYKGATIKILDIDYLKSQGACWARNLIQQFYNGEKYTMQLDSHHRFVPGWDKVCVEMLESLRYKSKKPLLTTYIPSFDPDNDPGARVQVPWKMDFDRFIPEGAVFFLPSSVDDHATRTEPMRARYYSAHFAFADGSFATEVQHDPQYFFHGEEISIGVRAFTHGYDLYHPHKLIAWHEYTRKNRTKIWDDHTTTIKNEGKVTLDWVERNNSCHKRNRALFGMDGEAPLDFGKYGFGTERTLREFEEYAGMDFKLRSVQQSPIDRDEPVYPVVKKYTPEEWAASMSRSNDIRICVHKNELQEIDDDYDFWFVGAHDEAGEIYRKDLTTDQIKEHLKNEWIDYRFIFLSTRIPTTYTVWPHSRSKGWRTKITKKVD